MWTIKDGICFDKNFPFVMFTTSSLSGDMKNKKELESFCLKNNIDINSVSQVKQVHSNIVLDVCGSKEDTSFKEADALVTNNKERFLAILTADCAPVFFADVKNNCAGIAHAGWRGLSCGIVENTFRMMHEKFGTNPENVYAAIGPHIHKCCYSVGDELKEIFGLNKKETHFSIKDETLKRLASLGIKNIFADSFCTMHNEDDFFSYRRNNTSKRMMSVIKVKSPE